MEPNLPPLEPLQPKELQGDEPLRKDATNIRWGQLSGPVLLVFGVLFIVIAVAGLGASALRGGLGVVGGDSGGGGGGGGGGGPGQPVVPDQRAPRGSYALYMFELWELHPTDVVRIVNVHDSKYATRGSEVEMGTPMLRPGDDVLAFAPINAELIDRRVEQPTYNGVTYMAFVYRLRLSGRRYGYDAAINHPPHLHVEEGTRLISIGVDPSNYEQSIVAVAIPADSTARQVYDFQPYRQARFGGWDVYYYNVSQVRSHVSIHIRYYPGTDQAALDWPWVESER